MTGEGRCLPAGVVLRAWRAEADFETMAAIENATRAVDGRESMTDAVQLRADIEFQGGIPEQAITFAELEGRAVGWSGGFCGRSEDEARWLLNCRCRVLAEHRRMGIGTALAHSAEAAAVLDADRKHPDDGFERVFECWLEDGEHAAQALLEELGYRPVRYGHHMTRQLDAPIPGAPLPAGIEIRPVTTETARAVLLGFDEASRDAWEYNGVEESQLLAGS